MGTSAERQRKRRARLKRQGIIDLSVTVPKRRAADLRRYAKSLLAFPDEVISTGRLLPALKALKNIRPQLEKAGIVRAGIFGSTARGEDTEDSDIDVIVDVNTEKTGDILNYIKAVDLIKVAIKSSCENATVEVANHASLKSSLRQAAERDTVYAY